MTVLLVVAIFAIGVLRTLINWKRYIAEKNQCHHWDDEYEKSGVLIDIYGEWVLVLYFMGLAVIFRGSQW